MSNRRAHPRIPLDVQFTCRDQSGTGELVFDAADLSAGGTFLRSDLLLEAGEKLSLEVALPGGRKIRADAQVVRAQRFPGPDQEPGMGVQFLGLTATDRQALEDFLAGG